MGRQPSFPTTRQSGTLTSTLKRLATRIGLAWGSGGWGNFGWGGQP